MRCDGCGHWNQGNAEQCVRCKGVLTPRRLCPQGHSIPRSLEACPYCPKPGPSEDSAAGVTPFSNSSANRSGTVVLNPSALPGGSDPSPNPAGGVPGVPTPIGVREKQTQVVAAARLVGFLVSYSLDSTGQSWPISLGRTRLGTDEDCDVTLAQEQISTHHAVISAHDHQGGVKLWITDQDSVNGTRLNGEPIFNQRPDLAHGDRIGIGTVELQVVLIPGS